MSTTVTSCVLVGVDPEPVRVEASLSGGRTQFHIVGLPDTAMRESRERVRAALKSSGFQFPDGRVVVSLSPADLPKSGAMYDLAIALAIVHATEGLGSQVGSFVLMGELSLRGHVERTGGAMVAASVAERLGATAVVPAGAQMPVACDTEVVGVETLRDAVEVVRGMSQGAPVVVASMEGAPLGDLCEVAGQSRSRRALELAAAGGHHLLMVGPPGAGKSMLASRLPTILPPLSKEQQKEVALVAAAARLPDPRDASPPYRAPHHSISVPALVGGGSGIPTPGELTKAHLGVLFLDELGEFPPVVLDALRQPMESGSVLVSRQAASIRFPARVQVVAASNPCPCGYLGDRKHGCTCPQHRRERYRERLSGPMLDRFDLRIKVERLGPLELMDGRGESSASVRERVVRARAVQDARGILNCDLTGPQLRGLEVVESVNAVLRSDPRLGAITARGWDRLRRVARTIADLAGEELVDDVHVKEALELRDDV